MMKSLSSPPSYSLFPLSRSGTSPPHHSSLLLLCSTPFAFVHHLHPPFPTPPYAVRCIACFLRFATFTYSVPHTLHTYTIVVLHTTTACLHAHIFLYPCLPFPHIFYHAIFCRYSLPFHFFCFYHISLLYFIPFLPPLPPHWRTGSPTAGVIFTVLCLHACCCTPRTILPHADVLTCRALLGPVATFYTCTHLPPLRLHVLQVSRVLDRISFHWIGTLHCHRLDFAVDFHVYLHDFACIPQYVHTTMVAVSPYPWCSCVLFLTTSY